MTENCWIKSVNKATNNNQRMTRLDIGEEVNADWRSRSIAKQCNEASPLD